MHVAGLSVRFFGGFSGVILPVEGVPSGVPYLCYYM